MVDLLRETIDQLRKLIPVENHQWKRTHIQWQDHGSQISYSTRPDFRVLTSGARHPDQPPAIDDLAASLCHDPRYMAIVDSVGGTRWLKLEPSEIALHVVREYLNQLESLEHDGVAASLISTNLLRSLEKRTTEVVLYTVVRGLTCDFRSRLLSSDLTLRRLTDGEITGLVDRFPYLVENDNIPQNRCLLQWTTTRSISNPPKDEFSRASDMFRNIVTAFRLLKGGRVEIENTYQRSELPGQIDLGGGYVGRINRRHPICNTYNLSEGEFQDLCQLWKAVTSGAVPRRLQTALDRVNFAAERDRPDDQLLDTLIAMEALFGDAGGAIGYKLGIRCAMFVEIDFVKRRGIRKIISDGYKARSALVHGGSRSDRSRAATDELVQQLLSLVRRGVSCMAENVLSGRKIPDPRDIDDLILRGDPGDSSSASGLGLR